MNSEKAQLPTSQSIQRLAITGKMGSPVTFVILYVLQLLALPYHSDAIGAPHTFRSLLAAQSSTALSTLTFNLTRPRDPHKIVSEDFRIVFKQYRLPVIDPWSLSGCIVDALLTAFHVMMYSGQRAPLSEGSYRCHVDDTKLSIYQDVRNFSYHEVVTLIEAIHDFSNSYIIFGMDFEIYDREELLLGHGSLYNAKNPGLALNRNASTTHGQSGHLLTVNSTVR